MKRLPLAITLGTALLSLELNAQTVDAPPTRPEGLRAVRYDGTGGELFWQRSTDDNGPVRGYLLTKNGQSLGIRDALSYSDRSLRPDVAYTFTVAAVDSAGQLSPLATTRLGPVAGESAPAAPAALRAERYSSRAIELFWERSSGTPSLRYEIRRNGEIVAVIDGTSYFTDSLRSDTAYSFTVVARDRAGRRSVPARLDVRTARSSTVAAVPSKSDHPPAPERLRVSVYSRTAAELFWERTPAERRLRYEVRRNGQILAITSGTSFYDDDLDPGTSYTFEVRVVTPDDIRSSPVRTTFAVPENVPPSLPPAPKGLRATVYSRTAAELFWKRENRSGLRYEVRRDGVSIAKINGTSFFDDTLSAGRTYAYEVIAIDTAGLYSPPTTIAVGTEGGRHADTASRAHFIGREWRQVVTEALEILDGLPFSVAAERAANIAVGTLGAMTPDPVLQFGSEAGETDETIACPNGGSLRSQRSVFSDPWTDLRDFDQFLFVDCVLSDGLQVDGEATFRDDAIRFRTGKSETRSISINALTIKPSDGTTPLRIDTGSRLTDRSESVTGECPDGGADISDSVRANGQLPIGVNGMVLERLNASYNGTYQIVGQDASGRDDCRLVETLMGSAELLLPDGRTLLVERRAGGVAASAEQTEARLTLRILPGGDSLTVSAVDTGAPATVRVEINEDGRTSAFQTTLDGWIAP